MSSALRRRGNEDRETTLYFLVGILGRTQEICKQRIPRAVLVFAQVYNAVKEWALRNQPLRVVLTFLTGVLSVLAYFSSHSLSKSIAERVALVRSLGGAPGCTSKRLFSYSLLDGLPEPAQRYFRYALREGQPILRSCAVRQAGLYRLRASPGQKRDEGWGTVKAVEFFSTAEPAYVWTARVKFAPGMWVRGWDSYCKGKGEVLFKLYNVYTMISDSGLCIDQWGLYRYLSEAVYFPTALLPSQHVRWEPVDKNSARCVLTHGSVTVSAVFHVTKSGAVDTMFTPKRIRSLKEDLTMETAHTWHWSDWQEREGVHVPLRCEMEWNLDGGTNLSYAKLVTTDISWSDTAASSWKT